MVELVYTLVLEASAERLESSSLSGGTKFLSDNFKIYYEHMNILLMGCSWAVPNYFGLPGDPPETHSEFLLKELGHEIHNCGLNAGSNLLSLERAKKYLSGEEIDHPAMIGRIKKHNPNPIDLVIWFHTEPGRDVGVINPTGKTINQQLNEICNVTYKSYADFFKNLNCKIAVIGGCSDIHPLIYQYIQPDFCLPSWQTRLIGKGSMGFGMSAKTTPTIEDVNFLDNALTVLDRMRASAYFPDGGHPGKKAHQELIDQLASVFKI